jgi:hypothetical protein
MTTLNPVYEPGWSASGQIRQLAAQVIGESPQWRHRFYPARLQELMNHLQNSDPMVQALALLAIEQSQEPDLFERIAHLADPDISGVATCAAYAIGHTEEWKHLFSKEVYQALLQRLQCNITGPQRNALDEILGSNLLD